MASILNRSPLAAICFGGKDATHIRIYFQDPQGSIRETYFDSGIGWHTRPENVIRVYFLAPDNQVVERCCTEGKTGTWTDGALTTNHQFMAAPYSQVGAVSFDSGLKEIRTYYQDTANKVCEVLFDNDTSAWFRGTNISQLAEAGTSISVIASASCPRRLLRIYYQLPNSKFLECIMNRGGHWFRGGFSPHDDYAPGSCLSALCSGSTEAVRVFGVNDTNRVTMAAELKDGWRDLVKLLTVIPGSVVAAIKVTAVGDGIRVYCQSSGSTISEICSNDAGEHWFMSQPALPISNW
ncbi:hypothetical protein F5Y04DRAFT_278979 [Hypomontagnella monticulosa]|nr:hypothetical protein F5Y04DRAFT_278979 [Hypomontagnella monticulosa]